MSCPLADDSNAIHVHVSNHMCVTNHEDVQNASAHQVIIGALRVNLVGTFGSK